MPLSRRNFIGRATAASGVAALTPLGVIASPSPPVQGTAEHVISVWLGGGMGHVDTFDLPDRMGDPAARKPGALYKSVDTAVPGVQVCEYLSQLAPLMDRVTAVRTVHHEVIDEHAAATNRMHTGRAISGTVTYPSLGSLIAHERGAASGNAPPYLLIGYPNVTRGPGFLGPRAGYVYLTDTAKGPAGLSRLESVTLKRQARRERFLATLRDTDHAAQDRRIADYEAAIDQCLKLSGPEFARAFQLNREPAELRNRYGGEFGQRCLLSRRLIERGSRFIEVSHNLNFINGHGWDVHHEGIQNQHGLIQEMDTALSALIEDLEDKKLLDKTLIIVTTEFGRPPGFDARGGRAHQGRTFSCVLAGGGLSHCGAYGQTDELCQKIVADPVSVPDFFATVCATVGVDYRKNLYDNDRPVPITDQGRPLDTLFP